jgi:hypothetical protein
LPNRYSEPPAITLGDAAISHDWRGSWFIGHTKSRMEKAFAWDLARQGIMYFLPLVPWTDRWGRKTKIPIFSGYVCFIGNAEERYSALATDRLCKVIEVVEQSRFIGSIIELQHRLLTDKRFGRSVVKVGERVELKNGAMKGQKGVVLRERDNQIVVGIEELGAAEIECDPSAVEVAA